MIDSAWWLSNLVHAVNHVSTTQAGGLIAPGNIGFVILAIIVTPVALLSLAAVFGEPRGFRVPGLFVGSLILLVGATILSFALFGTLLGFVLPK